MRVIEASVWLRLQADGITRRRMVALGMNPNRKPTKLYKKSRVTRIRRTPGGARLLRDPK